MIPRLHFSALVLLSCCLSCDALRAAAPVAAQALCRLVAVQLGASDTVAELCEDIAPVVSAALADVASAEATSGECRRRRRIRHRERVYVAHTWPGRDPREWHAPEITREVDDAIERAREQRLDAGTYTQGAP